MLNQPFFIPSVIFFIMAIPLIFNLIPRNRFYGVRTKKTVADDFVWYRSNKFGGRLVILSSMFYILFAFLFPAKGSHDPDFNLILLHLAAFALPLFISFYIISKYIKKL